MFHVWVVRCNTERSKTHDNFVNEPVVFHEVLIKCLLQEPRRRQRLVLTNTTTPKVRHKNKMNAEGDQQARNEAGDQSPPPRHLVQEEHCEREQQIRMIGSIAQKESRDQQKRLSQWKREKKPVVVSNGIGLAQFISSYMNVKVGMKGKKAVRNLIMYQLKIKGQIKEKGIKSRGKACLKIISVFSWFYCQESYGKEFNIIKKGLKAV